VEVAANRWSLSHGRFVARSQLGTELSTGASERRHLKSVESERTGCGKVAQKNSDPMWNSQEVSSQLPALASPMGQSAVEGNLVARAGEEG
jgi:hypothetical protein